MLILQRANKTADDQVYGFNTKHLSSPAHWHQLNRRNMGIGWILLIITIAFIFIYKKLTNNPDAITSKYETAKRLNGNINDHLRIIKEALKNAGFKKVGYDKEENRFYAQTKFSMSSFSEYIEVSIINQQHKSEITFKSICALPTQIFDWGKNQRNYKKFERELERLMPASPLATAS